jgi:hypothetical protein
MKRYLIEVLEVILALCYASITVSRYLVIPMLLVQYTKKYGLPDWVAMGIILGWGIDVLVGFRRFWKN